MWSITDRDPISARINLFHSILFIILKQLDIPVSLFRYFLFSVRDIAFALVRTFPYLSWRQPRSLIFHQGRAWTRPISLISLLRKDLSQVFSA
jgi:hypothetical protein